MKGTYVQPWKHKLIRENPDQVWQTRRLDNLKEINKEPDKWAFMPPTKLRNVPHTSIRYQSGTFLFQKNDGHLTIIKPRYQVGDVVFLQETWFVGVEYDALSPIGLWNHPIVGYMLPFSNCGSPPGRLRSPRFMPAWAARDFAKVLSVRLGRVQEITLQDIQAEGITLGAGGGLDWTVEARGDFIRLWDSIYPKYPWAMNSWCWRIEFKLVLRPEGL